MTANGTDHPHFPTAETSTMSTSDFTPFSNSTGAHWLPGDTYRIIIFCFMGGLLLICIIQYGCRYWINKGHREFESDRLACVAPIAKGEDDEDYDSLSSVRIYVLPTPGRKILEAQQMFGTVAVAPIKFIDDSEM
ncbi:hypothetical protein PMAYCL1PPCAC_31850 [Pristionchus mayeri]|uniref:Uncharacterized protein n=1 Tax=Pristionchus mayeri TaxID=1317129 RepID=A0AAN5DFA7_9BILA|nr:hypothetical protein PMAYCL1PPCAC_31850 [Pristionchus mayeri]